MFSYTKAAIDKIKNDLKIGVAIFEIITIVLIITYLIFALSLGFGNLIINSVLLAVVSVYFILFLINLKFNLKCFRSKIKKYYKRIRLAILASSLSISMYELYVTTNDVNPITIILITLLLIFWILQIVTEIIYRLMANEIDLLVQAIAQDKTNALEPVRKLLNKEESHTKSKKSLSLRKKWKS